jgi:Protein of unknown function (DUF3592)
MKRIIIGFCLFAVGGWILITGIISLMMDCRARSWPIAEGALQSSKCVRYYDMESGIFGWSYFTYVNYSYAVAGKSYKGDRIAFGYSGSWWRRPNQKIADRLSPARTVLVRYDPDKPSTAVLSYGLNGSNVRTLFIGSWIILMTAVGLLHVYRSRNNVSFLVASWHFKRFNVVMHGIGGIVLLVVAGLVIFWLLGLVIDWGILSTIETR